jgi:hypothetical protein
LVDSNQLNIENFQGSTKTFRMHQEKFSLYTKDRLQAGMDLIAIMAGAEPGTGCWMMNRGPQCTIYNEEAVLNRSEEFL